MTITDHELAVAAAQAGAEVVRAGYGSALARFDKGSGDFATAADVEAERVIVELLRAARPDDTVVGEESGRTGSGGSGREWLVDPLCGTLNFAARSMLVAVNVALRSGPESGPESCSGSGSASGAESGPECRSEVVAAATADPFSGEVFWTDGTRARVRHDGVDADLRPSAESHLVDVNLDPPFPNDPAFRAVRLLANRHFAERFRPRVLSTTLAVAWVAAGRRAGYVTDGHLRDSVHFASGIALCRAAGCVLTDLRGNPLHSGTGGLVVAADEPTHAALLGMVDEQFRTGTGTP
ncbi:inositol monophosphatase family protein [Micromonospora sp. WMMD1102]|uniref:inositol monophosphatase family protein n=1 Tax=Micromonospora sp. WMMD1102 TaxID=3016105 RepID=UPI0024157DA2|nr:inositol monophosphatase family protein [Micromonospora sp. WMMD1102]MDG4788420.1 inositol monophosphatase family protein [Micromonospora sp. WMMD1102]